MGVNNYGVIKCMYQLQDLLVGGHKTTSCLIQIKPVPHVKENVLCKTRSSRLLKILMIKKWKIYRVFVEDGRSLKHEGLPFKVELKQNCGLL